MYLMLHSVHLRRSRVSIFHGLRTRKTDKLQPEALHHHPHESLGRRVQGRYLTTKCRYANLLLHRNLRLSRNDNSPCMKQTTRSHRRLHNGSNL